MNPIVPIGTKVKIGRKVFKVCGVQMIGYVEVSGSKRDFALERSYFLQDRNGDIALYPASAVEQSASGEKG